MKKVISVILAIAMIASLMFVFSACGENKTTDNDKTDGKTDEKPVLVMATNATFPPYEYKGDSGEIEGIDAEIAALIAEKLGMTLKIEDVDFGAIVAGVASGKYDIGMAGMTVNEERLESVNFSTSYAKGIQSVIVKADSPYTKFEEFYATFNEDKTPATVKEGIKIGVQQDTTGDIYSSDKPENNGFGEDNVIRYKDGPTAVQALVSGKITAVIIDNNPAKAYVAENDGLKILDGAYADENYAIAINKNNNELLEKVNKALEELKNEGKLDEIINKYIKE
mgnify:FL=1